MKTERLWDALLLGAATTGLLLLGLLWYRFSSFYTPMREAVFVQRIEKILKEGERIET